MSKVIVHRNAAKYLQKLPKDRKERVKGILRELKTDPLDHANVKHMMGEWSGYHRLRAGSLRIIFWYDETADTVYVDHIGPRGDVYK